MKEILLLILILSLGCITHFSKEYEKSSVIPENKTFSLPSNNTHTSTLSADDDTSINIPTSNSTNLSTNTSSDSKEGFNNTDNYCAKYYSQTYWKENPFEGFTIEMGYGGNLEKEIFPYEDSFDKLKKLGVKVVNLEVQYTWTINKPYSREEEIIQEIHKALTMLREKKFCVVFSIRNGPGRNDMFSGIDERYDGREIDLIYHNGDAQDAWIQMLKDTANEFRNYDNIIAWDPMVEPAPSIYYGDEDNRRYEWWNEFAVKCVKAIREVDKKRVITIEAADWSNPHAFKYLEPIDDNNTVYNVHNYWPMEYTHQYEEIKYKYPGEMCYWDEIYEDEMCGIVNKQTLLRSWSPVKEFEKKYNATIYVGEWGSMLFQPGVDKYLSDQHEIIKMNNWSHTVYAWGYDPGWEIQAFSYTTNPDKCQLVIS